MPVYTIVLAVIVVASLILPLLLPLLFLFFNYSILEHLRQRPFLIYLIPVKANSKSENLKEVEKSQVKGGQRKDSKIPCMKRTNTTEQIFKKFI